MKRYRKLVVFIVFSILISNLIFWGYKNYNLILDVIYPVQKGIYSSVYALLEIRDLVIKNNQILDENRKLRQEIIKLKQKLQNLKYLEYENAKLKQLLQYVSSLKIKKFKLARVISFSSNNWENYIIIDAGKENNINIGDLVVSDGYLVGKITETGHFSSKVILVNDLDFKITARTQKTREYVFLEGDGENAILKFVKKGQDIRVGDIVETDIPKGIPIGKIIKVEDYPTEFFKKVKVQPFLKPFRLEYVLVLKVDR